jgi:F-box protein 9
MSAGTSDIPAPEQEPTELARFREQWKAEVRERQAATSGAQAQPVPGANTAAERAISPARSDASAKPATITNTFSTSRGPATHVVAGAPTVITHTSHGQSHLSPNLAHAVEVYRKAVFHEQHSQLDDALRLYRQAFRLDANVDRAYFIEEQRTQERSAAQPATHKKASSIVSVDEVTRDVQKLGVHQDNKNKSFVASGFLAQVLKNFPENLVFEPEDEKEGLPPINLIPDEVLLQILRILDYTTIERFAAVSRKARVLSLDSAIWRDFVQLAYKPPQIADDESISNIVEQYSLDYRRAYIEHPRLRLDGVYIAVCHYMRMGSSENAWVNVSHLITYHRYLRFFPNGQVLSLLANEEWQPQTVIPMLKPNLRMKGFYIGDWSLSGSTVYITNLVEKHLSHAHATTESQPNKYIFQMTLALRSRPLGRWNKLDFIGYDSVNVEDGEAIPLPLKNERSFWFSKVKSWAGY